MALGWVGLARPSPTLHPGHAIELSYQTKWFDQPERLERFAAFFKALTEASDAFYGRVFRFTSNDQLEPPVFDRELWDVLWLNYLAVMSSTGDSFWTTLACARNGRQTGA